MSENIFDQISDLSKEIVSDAIAPRETQPEYPNYEDFKDAEGNVDTEAYRAAGNARGAWRPSDEASAQKHTVRSVRDVKIGDVLVVVENEKHRGDYATHVWPHTTFSDLLTGYQPKGTLWVVVGMSGKMFTAIPLRHGFWSYDLATLERPEGDYAKATEVRMSGTILSRDVLSTGLTYDELIERIKADKRFAKALKMQAKATALQEAYDAEMRAEREAAEAAKEPVKQQAARLNDAVSVRVAEVKSYGTPEVQVRDLKWLGYSDFYSLTALALEARLLKREITQQQYDDALATLRQISGEDD